MVDEREGDVSARIEFLGDTPNRIVGIWRIEAAGRPLRRPAELEHLPEGVVLSSLDELRAARRLPKLAEAYREIFGAAEVSSAGDVVWGEGASCGICGTMIPLPEFREIASAAEPLCPTCGEGLLVEIFPRDTMLQTLESVLEPAPGWDPLVTLLEDPEGDVHGFMYGAVSAPRQAILRMHEEQAVYPDAPGLDTLASFYAGVPDVPVFYFEAGAVEPRARDGLRTLHALTGLTYTRAVELGARALIGWTTSRTNAYGLMLAQGSEIVARHGDYVYLYLRDLVPVTSVLQNTTLEEIAPILQRCFEALETDGIPSPPSPAR